AEKIFRIFDKALLTGDRKVIESLIIENKDAEVLWAKAYPKIVALKLNEISEAQPIKSIPVSEDGKTVKIITQGWPFPILMNFINGEWKVNAEKIIELRKANK
ncbi:MAG: hypothetical protein KDD63_07065, partial [Bacteroidetes bacterium]|nr:hypothetical protein [Bacteroidota bacterium]